MSENDYDTNGPSREELSDLLRSMPREQAPASLEPELMQRLAEMRRRRGIVAVLHGAARSDWAGGLFTAATAAAVVAGSWLMLQQSEPSSRDTVRPAGIVRDSVATAPERPAARTHDEVSADAPVIQERPVIEQQVAPARPSVAAGRTSAAVPNRRAVSSSRRRSAARVVSQPIDTITATRLRARSAPRTAPASDAGAGVGETVTTTPVPSSPRHRDESTGVDTGGPSQK